MKKFQYRVDSVRGFCSCGYREGDLFYCEGMNTPDVPFCGGAYMILFPVQVALHAGAVFHFEAHPKCRTKLACPDEGKVLFSIMQLEEEGLKQSQI